MKKKAIILLIGLIVINTLTRVIVENSFATGDLTSVLGIINLIKIYNIGIAYGMFANMQILVELISIGAIIYIGKLTLEYLNDQEKMKSYTLAMVLAGSISNLGERIFTNYVVDYIQITIGNYASPVFNLADCMITFGFAIFLMTIITDTKGEV